MSQLATPPQAKSSIRWHDLIEVGDVVHWYDAGLDTSDPCMALVSRKGNNTLQLHVLAPDLVNFLIRDGVRYIGDPKAKNDMVAGAWKPTPRTKKIIELTGR